MTPRKLIPRGRSYISDGKLLMSLEGELGELPPQELVAILAALRDRKKYFRLHNGSMLSLDEVGADWLELADAVADAGVVRKSGVLELESYRATYLNSLLKGLSNMSTDESVDSASRLEAPTDPCPEELAATLRPYQGARIRVAAGALQAASGRRAGRRHGPGQDAADDSADALRHPARRTHAVAGRSAHDAYVQLAQRAEHSSRRSCARWCWTAPA